MIACDVQAVQFACPLCGLLWQETFRIRMCHIRSGLARLYFRGDGSPSAKPRSGARTCGACAGGSGVSSGLSAGTVGRKRTAGALSRRQS